MVKVFSNLQPKRKSVITQMENTDFSNLVKMDSCRANFFLFLLFLLTPYFLFVLLNCTKLGCISMAQTFFKDEKLYWFNTMIVYKCCLTSVQFKHFDLFNFNAAAPVNALY